VSESGALLFAFMIESMRDDILRFAESHPDYPSKLPIAEADPKLRVGTGFQMLSPEELFLRWRMTVVNENARRAVEEYCRLESPDREQRCEIAANALRLAKLDPLLRARKLDPTFESADAGQIEELIELLAIVPFDSLIDPTVMILNPSFGKASRLVGGADTDLITGEILVDVKTVKIAETDAKYLDQLFGYFLLARRAAATGEKIPAIRTVALYFSRHAHLWTQPTTFWLDRAEFDDVERWFFERTAELSRSLPIENRNPSSDQDT
jgi:hypothetical protein